MIGELDAYAELFSKLDRDIRAATKDVRERLGIKDEMIEAKFQILMAKAKNNLESD